ncbi:hypothetical protein ACU4GD_40830 [Cupriavidus basilensis]
MRLLTRWLDAVPAGALAAWPKLQIAHVWALSFHARTGRRHRAAADHPAGRRRGRPAGPRARAAPYAAEHDGPLRRGARLQPRRSAAAADGLPRSRIPSSPPRWRAWPR